MEFLRNELKAYTLRSAREQGRTWSVTPQMPQGSPVVPWQESQPGGRQRSPSREEWGYTSQAPIGTMRKFQCVLLAHGLMHWAMMFPLQSRSMGTAQLTAKGPPWAPAAFRNSRLLEPTWQSHWRKWKLTRGQKPPECDRLVQNRTAASSADSSSFLEAPGRYF